MDLQKLQELAGGCMGCELWQSRNKAVFARGNPNTQIMICGMCPGPDENKEGYPFVEYAAAGKVLNSILMEVFGTLDAVYITNLVKCFVQPGKSLEQGWMDACVPYLITQIGLIDPRVIIALGKDVSNYLLNNTDNMGQLRGKSFSYMKRTLICTYHPSYLARGGGVNHKHYGRVINDFKMVSNYII